MKKVIIIGAGPAGLATAYELLNLDKKKQFDITILEQDNQVGGLAKTLVHNGYRFDLGGHRFYTKFPEIDSFYKTFLGKEMLTRDRLSRIYYQKKFYNYPLSASNALINLGLPKTSKILFSWLKRQFNRYPEEKTFEEWVSNRFGDELFEIFFKSYTEKVWGISTKELSADWAAQRIQDFNLLKATLEAVFNIRSGSKTTITKFFYPKFGPGMLYDKLTKIVTDKGVKLVFDTQVIGFLTNSKNTNIQKVIIKDSTGKIKELSADLVVSSMPFNQLILYLKPPKHLQKEATKLKFRNFITVNLIVKSNPFPDQWIYIHEPNVKVGRIQNFRNWSPYMVKSSEKNTPIGMEYFCEEGDTLWNLSEKELINLAKEEIVSIGLVNKDDILSGFVYKVKNAYPVYNFDYETPFKKAKSYIERYTNLYLCGRGGLFRYNNQDHSILTGFYVARNIYAGENKYDVWTINEGNEYLESKK